ncbi:MAG: ATP-grasp domain-containing protein, partial [Shewanellaceae bacterium]|nr:ATP-grasp domain-containing protein [Shewanellaceae bacterium]
MIATILIANRGEIACRVIKTARRLGLTTVAVFAEPDRDAKHVQLADQAICLGPASVQASYLNQAAILQAAKDTGADAIHPGYGFLSEQADFARACTEQGICFIGPAWQTIHTMGDKIQAKMLMETLNIPCIPGCHSLHPLSETALLSQANHIGFPLLIKAAAGGGGKGMRVVHHPQDFIAAFKLAQAEAEKFFGAADVLLEKFVLKPRHIEIQIIADQQGHVVCLGSRDCSIQRRHQKIIEEAPAPELSKTALDGMIQAATTIAQHLKYVGVGTLEFLVDTAEDFYFMEMNTRLQVEHTVTEMIYDLDLVAWQIRIANGESIP